MKRAFLWMFAVVSVLWSIVAAKLRQSHRRIDPLDNLGLFLSPIVRQFRKHSDVLCYGLAAVALAVLPASAMPVWSAKTAVTKFVVAHKLGLAGAMVAGATQQQDTRLPFRYGTVRRRINIGQYPITLGTAVPSITIPQVGMLSKVIIDIEGTYTKANASGTNLYDGYDAIMQRARVGLNNGSANLVDLSGVGINILNQDLSPSLPIKRGLVTTAGAQTFSYKYVLPVNANDRRQFEMGLINLQAPEIRATVDLSFNQTASVFATPADVTAFAATANVSYEYFEIPPISQYKMPPLTLVRAIEEAPIAVAATGQQLYQIPRLGTMFDFHAVMVLNNVYTTVLTKVNDFSIRYNKSDVQYFINIGDQETYEALLYGRLGGATKTFLNASAISFNLWSADNTTTNGGDFRDAIDTEENTTTESLITVASGTSLNAGKDNFFYVRRVVQRITAAPGPVS